MSRQREFPVSQYRTGGCHAQIPLATIKNLMFSQKTRKSITNQENVDVLRPIICSLFLARDQQIVIFSANRNRNRFAGPSVRIGIGIVPEFQNLQIGIGIIFVRWEEFANYSQIPEIYFSFLFSKKIFFLTIIYFFH